MTVLTLHIAGMTCSHCLNTEHRALSSIPGARPMSVRVGRADLEYDQGQTSSAAIIAAVPAAGYTAVPLPG